MVFNEDKIPESVGYQGTELPAVMYRGHHHFNQNRGGGTKTYTGQTTEGYMYK